MKRSILLSLAGLTALAACMDSPTRPTDAVVAPQEGLKPLGPVKDDIANKLDGTVDAMAEVMPLTVGGASGTTQLIVSTRNDDEKNGCNFQGPTASLVLSVSSSNTAVATVSPSSVTFGNCGDIRTLTVTPGSAGSATISLTQTSNNTGTTFTLAPATFDVNVTAPTPANTAPTIVVAGVTMGASYNKGSVPAATCQVTDAEDGNSSFAATLDPVEGPYASSGVGSQTARCSYKDGGGLEAVSSVTYNIVDPSTATSVISSLNPSKYQEEVTFTASVLGVTPATAVGANGSITFKSGGESCSDASALSNGTVALDANGQASYTTSSLAVANPVVIRACYSGSGSAYAPSENKLDQIVDKADQVIVFGPLSKKTYGDEPFKITATGGASGNPVTFTKDASSVGCSLATANSETTVTITGASGSGKCVINANQTGNSNYNDAEQMQASFSIDKAPLTVTATASSTSKTFDGDGFDPQTFGVTYGAFVNGDDKDDLSGALVLTVTPGVPTYPHAGTYSLVPSGLTSSDYEITFQNATLTIDRAPQTISFGALANRVFSTTPFTVNATGGASGNPVVFTLAAGSAGCSVGGTNGTTVTMLQANVTPQRCLIEANQAGNTDYYDAPAVQQGFQILAWTLSGFYQPVDMNGVFNTVKAGSTVPLKFEVFAGPTELTLTSVIKTFSTASIPCSGTAPTDEIEITTTGGTSLRFDATGGQFIQNWQTQGKAGSCIRVTMTTQDGSSLVALFKLK